jgi:WD40 repeat protein/beta-lactamase regulating signal transducer with metallopeptidase domain
MSTLLSFGLANAVCAAVLAAVALVAGRFCRRPAVIHSLWLLVLLKLVTPPLWPITVATLPEEPPPVVETKAIPTGDLATYVELAPSDLPSTVLENVQKDQQRNGWVANQAGIVRFQNGGTSSYTAGSAARIQMQNIFVLQEPAHSSTFTVVTPSDTKRQQWASLVPFLSLAWLSGFVVWLMWAGLHVARFHRLLRHARRASPEIQKQCDRLAAQMDLSRSPEIWLLPGPLPPLVWAALGRVRIFFPARLLARLDDTERGSLLAHELAHVRRRDHWVRWLELIASAVYWWYPLVWLARRRLHVHEEECCDAWVVSEIPARVYAGAIVNTLDFLAEDRAPLPVMASGLAGVDLMKRRLSLIMAGGTPKRLSSSGKIALVLAGMLLLSLRPNVAHTEAKLPAEKETKEEPAAKIDAVREKPVEESTAFDPQSKELPGPKLESSPLAIARSPDGKTLALALADQTVQLRNSSTGALRLTLKGHEDAVTCLAFAPDGKLLATGSPDRRVRVWDTETGKLHHVLEGHATWIYAVAFSPDGKTLASGGYDKTIRLWDAATGAVHRILKGHKASVRALAFSPDGKTLASGGSDRTIRLWTMNAEGEPLLLKGHEDTVRVLAFSPDGKTLASGSDDQTVKLWDTAEKSERVTLKGGHTTEVTTLIFSPRGKVLLSAAAGGGIILWDAATGTQLSQLSAHNDAVTGLTYLDSKRLLSAGLDGKVKIWQPLPSPIRLLRGHTGPVAAVVISRDGRRLLTGSGWPQGDKSARLWDLNMGKQIRVFRAETPPVGIGQSEQPNQIEAVAFSPDGKLAISGGVGGVVFLWDVEKGKELRRFHGHFGAVYALDYALDGRHILSGGRDKTIRLWEVQSGREVRKFEGPTDWVRSVRFNRDGKRFLSGGRDGVLRLWDVDGGKQLHQFQTTEGWTDSVVWMPDQRHAVCAAGGSVIQLWDLEKRELVRSFAGHAGGVTAVDVSQDGSCLLSSGYDGTVRFWDVATGKQQKMFRQPGFVRAVKFSMDGRYAISAGGGRNEGDQYVPGAREFPLRVWSLNDEQMEQPQARRERQRPELPSSR